MEYEATARQYKLLVLFNKFQRNNLIKYSEVKNILVSMGADYSKIIYEAYELANIELLNFKQFEQLVNIFYSLQHIHNNEKTKDLSSALSVVTFDGEIDVHELFKGLKMIEDEDVVVYLLKDAGISSLSGEITREDFISDMLTY